MVRHAVEGGGGSHGMEAMAAIIAYYCLFILFGKEGSFSCLSEIERGEKKA